MSSMQDDAAEVKKATTARVESRKAELVTWLHRYSPVDQIEARIAMLETVLDALIDIHGEFDTAEIVTVAMQRSVIKAQRAMQ